MDFCRNIPMSAALPTDTNLGSLDDLFSGHPTEGDVNLEWLSIFVEDCLSSTGNCLPPQILPPIPQKITTEPIITTNPKPQIQTLTETPKSQIHKFIIPSKARTKRKRNPLSITKNPSRIWSSEFKKFNNPNGKSFRISNSDPPLLQQTYWLADSELILPKNGEMMRKDRAEMEGEDDYDDGEERLNLENQLQVQTRRCSHCLSQRTPQWRAGPLGPKTLCNACGVRYKSGRLLPEYRPAKSPTFVSYKHSNSHKKVLEMRMSSSSSST